MSTVVVRRSVIVKIRSYGLLKVILDTKNYRFEASCVVDPHGFSKDPCLHGKNCRLQMRCILQNNIILII